MDRLLILKSYLRSGVEWEGDAQIKKDLATLRRTRTQLAALMESYRLEDALEPQHKLALQAAAAVLMALLVQIAVNRCAEHGSQPH